MWCGELLPNDSFVRDREIRKLFVIEEADQACRGKDGSNDFPVGPSHALHVRSRESRLTMSILAGCRSNFFLQKPAVGSSLRKLNVGFFSQNAVVGFSHQKSDVDSFLRSLHVGSSLWSHMLVPFSGADPGGVGMRGMHSSQPVDFKTVLGKQPTIFLNFEPI